MFMVFKRKNIIFLALLLVLLLAFVINGVMERQREQLLASSGAITEGKVLGEAKLVDSNTGAQGEVQVSSGAVSSGYFADARINRQKARDSAIELLQSVLNNKTLSDEAKREAAGELGILASITNAESAIENLIKAKGFTDTVAIIGEKDITIVVQTKGLTPSDISKIKDIVMREASVGADNIKIIEVK